MWGNAMPLAGAHLSTLPPDSGTVRPGPPPRHATICRSFTQRLVIFREICATYESEMSVICCGWICVGGQFRISDGGRFLFSGDDVGRSLNHSIR